MITTCSLSRLFSILMLVFYGADSQANNSNAQAMDGCISVARHQLENFHLDTKLLEERCECVNERLNGNMPSTAESWVNSPRDVAHLTLLACSKSDGISYFSGEFLKSEISTLKTIGEPIQEQNIQD